MIFEKSAACIILLVIQVYGGIYPCVDPATNCATANPGDEVPDPENCQNYYICLVNGGVTVSPSTCPNGGYFDNTIAPPACNDTLTSCPEPCSGTGPGPNNCPIACGENDYAFDPSDCTKFYECKPGDVLSLSCLPGTYFSVILQDCVPTDSDCCGEVCGDPCAGTTGVVQVPDPLSCDGFRVCNGGVVIEVGICDDGQVFSGPLGSCVTGLECIIYCPSQFSTTTLRSTTITTQSSSIGSTPPTETTDDTSATTITGISTDQTDVTSDASTDTSPTNTDTSTISGINCKASLECTELGSFPKCDNCVAEYFVCTEESGNAVETKCQGDFLYDQTINSCVPESVCTSLVTTVSSTQASSTNTGQTNTPIVTTDDSISSSPDNGNCITSFICPGPGSFPSCVTTCSDKYFSCLSNGEEGVLTECAPGFLFDPNDNICVPEEICTPYEWCEDSLTCEDTGSFPKCQSCEPEYFVCLEIGEEAIETTCADGFDYDPTINTCVPEGVCESKVTPTFTTIATTPTFPANGNCIDSVECTENGNVAQCEVCFQQYFVCFDDGSALTSCEEGFLFDPVKLTCVPEDDCNDITTPPGTSSPETSTTTDTISTQPTTPSAPSTSTTSTTTTTPTISTTPIISSTPTTTDTTSTTPTTTDTTSESSTTERPPTTSTSTTTTTDTTPTPGFVECRESYICTTPGREPVCPYCTSEYFFCEDSSGNAEIMHCDDGFLFDPNFDICRLEEDCTNLPGYTPPIDTTTSGSIGGCRTTYQCTEVGRFAECTNQCTNSYFNCETSNQFVTELTVCQPPEFYFNQDCQCCLQECFLN